MCMATIRGIWIGDILDHFEKYLHCPARYPRAVPGRGIWRDDEMLPRQVPGTNLRTGNGKPDFSLHRYGLFLILPSLLAYVLLIYATDSGSGNTVSTQFTSSLRFDQRVIGPCLVR